MTDDRRRIPTRPWADRDVPVVAALRRDIWGANPPPQFAVHGPPSDEPGAVSRTVVAETDGRVLGVGTIWESRLHPARWRLAIHVRAEHRRHGVGSVLYGELVAFAARRDPRPLQAATSADDRPGRCFLDRHGFRPVMRTRLGLLDPHALPRHASRAIEDATARATDSGYRLRAVPDLPPDPNWESALAALQAEIYRLGHVWDPPLPLTTDQARRLFLDPDDLIPEAFYVALDRGDPVAIASLRRATSPGEFELGWVGAAANHHAHEADLVAALVGRCLTHAAAEQRRVRLEIDEAAAHLWRLVEPWPVMLEPDWLTLTRPNHARIGR